MSEKKEPIKGMSEFMDSLKNKSIKPIKIYKGIKASVMWPGQAGIQQAIFEVGKTFQGLTIENINAVAGGIEVTHNKGITTYLNVPMMITFDFSDEIIKELEKAKTGAENNSALKISE